MTTALLNQLHDHKLTQVRARAQKQIELWREAIAVVKKAEQEAKCIIDLPEQLTNINAVEKRVGSVGYMDVMELEDEVSRSREQVYEFAVDKLNKLRERLQSDSSNQSTGPTINSKNNAKTQVAVPAFINVAIISFSVLFLILLVLLMLNPRSDFIGAHLVFSCSRFYCVRCCE